MAARRIARELRLAGDGLALFPSRGRVGLAPGTRELATVQPYVLVYEATDTEVVIEEQATAGPGALMPKPLQDPLLHWRNTESLRRLAFLAEGKDQKSRSS